MNLEKRLKEIKKGQAYKNCFGQVFYDICGIHAIPSIHEFPGYETLRIAHCMSFADLNKAEINELKRMTREAIAWTLPAPPAPPAPLITVLVAKVKSWFKRQGEMK